MDDHTGQGASLEVLQDGGLSPSRVDVDELSPAFSPVQTVGENGLLGRVPFGLLHEEVIETDLTDEGGILEKRVEAGEAVRVSGCLPRMNAEGGKDQGFPSAMRRVA